MNSFYVSVGSNVGDRWGHIERARELLERVPGVDLDRCSAVYETEAVGPGKHPAFLNAVFAGTTELAPLALLDALHEIEDQLGRRRERRWAPRTMDLDLLMVGGRVLNTPRLTLPHPRIAERRFVLVPLAEVAPGLRHPILDVDAAGLLARCRDQSWVREVGSPVGEPSPC